MRGRSILLSSALIVIVIMAAATVRAQETDVDITVSFSNLAVLDGDHYEGWLIVSGSPVTTGKFKVGSTGELQDLDGNSMSTFQVSGVDLDETTKFVLSIEPAGDTDSVPADVKPLAGDLNVDRTMATLSPNLGAGVSLEGISGVYILATPSDGPDTNESSGVWFLDRSGAAPVAGLDLPDLTGTDWVYEGWAVIDGTPVTSGTFVMPAGADMAAPYSGTLGTPPFPGEDYLVNAPAGLTFPTNLSNGKIVVSIEPRVDSDPAPFQFKPLAGDVPSDAQDHLEYDLTDQASTLASGSVTIAEVPPALGIGDYVLWVFIGAVAVVVVITLVLILARRRGPPQE